MRCIKLIVVALSVAVLAGSAHAQDGNVNGGWMTIGVPRYVHQGTLGARRNAPRDTNDRIEYLPVGN